MPRVKTYQTPRHHTEYSCHAVGEARQNILNELKILFDQLDDRPCLAPDLRKKDNDSRPMMKYPGYVDRRHPAFTNKFARRPFLYKDLQEMRDVEARFVHIPGFIYYKKMKPAASILTDAGPNDVSGDVPPSEGDVSCPCRGCVYVCCHCH